MRTAQRFLCGLLAGTLLAVAAPAAAQTACTATFRLDDAITLGALQFEVAYPQPDVDFDGTGPAVNCTNLSTAFPTFDDDDAGNVSQAFVSFGGGFSGPRDISRCTLTAFVPITEGDLVVAVTDASDPSSVPVSPLPSVSVSLFCDGDPTTTTTAPTTTSTTLPMTEVCYVQVDLADAVTLGSLQVEMDYATADGEFDGFGSAVNCSTLVAAALGSHNDNDAGRVVTTAIIKLGGFSGPTPLYECLFLPNASWPLADDFILTITDAGDPDSNPVFPRPAIVVSAVDCFDPTATTTTTTTSTTSTTTTSTTTTTVAGPTCGNGVLEGFEECDDGNLVDGDGCSAACIDDWLCGDADLNLRVTAADAQRILHAAVGLIAECLFEVCDTSGDSTLTVGDAQRVLRFAVGLPSELLCS